MKTFLLFCLLFISSQRGVLCQAKETGLLLEEYTSQTCKYSPRGDDYIDSVCKIVPNVVALVWHYGGSLYPDDFALRATDTAFSIYVTTGFPLMVSNRKYSEITPDFIQSDIFFRDHIQIPAGLQSDLGISLVQESYDWATRIVDC